MLVKPSDYHVNFLETKTLYNGKMQQTVYIGTRVNRDYTTYEFKKL